MADALRLARRGLPRITLPLLVATAAGLTIPAYLLLVRHAGFRIPNQPSLEGDYLTGVAWAVALGITILFWPVPLRDKPTLLGIWLAKGFVALVVMLAYEWYYGLDAFHYFSATVKGPIPIAETGWGYGTQNLLAMAWVHNHVMPPSYHAMKISFAMLGLIGVYLIYRGCVRAWGREDRRLLLVLALFPSSLFWSSILGKEPLQLLAVGTYVYGVLSLRATQRWYFAIPVALGIALATYMRAWYGLIMLVPLLVFVVRALRGAFARVLFLCIAAVAVSWASTRFAERMRIGSLQDIVLTAEVVASGFASDDASLQGRVPFTDFGSMVRFAPVGAFAALFSPLPGQVMNPFGLLAGMENGLLLAMVGLAIARADRRRLREPLVEWGITLVVVWSAFHAFVSYYNAGAAVRFRLPILPVLLCLLIYLSRHYTPYAAPTAEKS